MRTPRVLLRANAKTGTVGHLVIAAGTHYEIHVRDARSIYKWAKPSLPFRGDVERRIVYHHTAAGVAAKRSARYELNLLIEMARSSEWGLPYNFMVMPVPPFRVWYLNDVDMCWPHTFGHNCDTAIAAYGNFETDRPDPRLAKRMMALADALATMWGEWVEESQHRDWNATVCPGQHLAALLPGQAGQRDFQLP
jgi:hypothetical protein